MKSVEPIMNDGNIVFTTTDDMSQTEGTTINGHADTKSSSVLHRSLHHDPLKVVSASGLYLTLSNGQKILDATGGAAVSCLGHGHERIKNAIKEQMEQVSYCHSLFFGTDAAEELAKELVQSTNGEMQKVFVISSGL